MQGLQLLLLRLPGDLPPRTYTLTAQVIDRRSGQALPAAEGEPVIRLSSVLGQLANTPRLPDPAKLPNPMQVVQSNGLAAELALRGYDLKSSHIRSGEELTLTLHWQVLQPPPQDYRLQFFLTDEQGETVYRWPDLPPINGEWPTRQWPADYWVQDRLDLPWGADVPPGQFRLRATWVAGETQSTSGQTWPGFDLGWITVTSER
ncbi:MAG: hypothetical protein HC875_25270 [Anaerolineales bacterium]|nr:hypothetical protein [Anaerolineales bacterium]